MWFQRDNAVSLTSETIRAVDTNVGRNIVSIKIFIIQDSFERVRTSKTFS